MAKILSGTEVAEALDEKLRERVRRLEEKGEHPTLAIIRAGDKVEDISYEKGTVKRAETVGVAVNRYTFAGDVREEMLINCIRHLNEDEDTHGVVICRPLPEHIDDNRVRKALRAEKDVDGITDQSMAGVYTGTDLGYPPCTPRACIAMLEHYGIEVEGKKVVVVGRSLVVGRALAMMLLDRDATPIICHRKTEEMKELCRSADILLVSAGQAEMIDGEYLSAGQIVVDVGINRKSDGKLCGDVDFEAACDIVEAITPVPGGVGKVTTGLLMNHVIDAAERKTMN